MKKLILTFLIIGTLTACNEEEMKGSFSNSELMNTTGCDVTRVLTDVQIEAIAIQHNETLIAIVDNNDGETHLNQSAMYSDFQNQLIDIGTPSNLIEPLLNQSYNKYDFITSNSCDPDVKTVMDACILYGSQNQSVQFNILSNFIETQEAFARNNIHGIELDYILTFLATYRRSSYLWMNISQGGLGYGSRLLDKLELPEVPPGNLSVAVNWGQIARADGEGAVTGLMACFFGGPLTWPAIVGAIGIGAACSSYVALMSNLCIQVGWGYSWY